MSNISPQSNLTLGLLVSILAAVGFLFETGAVISVSSFLRGTTLLTGFGIGVLAGVIIVIATVLANWLLTPNKANWYVPMSWFLIGLALGTIIKLFLVSGIGAVVGFLTSYTTLTWIPVRIGFYVGTEALSVLGVTSFITWIIFVIMFVIKLTSM